MAIRRPAVSQETETREMSAQAAAGLGRSSGLQRRLPKNGNPASCSESGNRRGQDSDKPRALSKQVDNQRDPAHTGHQHTPKRCKFPAGLA
jgi:hypothetical protein